MTYPTTSAAVATKRRRKLTENESDSTEHQPLLPGLPNHIAQLCLSHIHPSTLFSVSRSWRRVIYSASFPPFLSLYALLIPTTDHQTQPIELFSFDPISSRWDSVTAPPLPPPPLRPILRHHPSFLSRHLPVQSVSVSGSLVLLAATGDDFLPALPRPLVFDPISRNWGFGPPLATPRRWCVAGASGGAVFLASGIGSHFSTDVARSVEKWEFWGNNRVNRSCINFGEDLLEFGGDWVKLSGMRDGKFSRDAIDGVGWKGKLCMVNVKGDSAKQGLVYDIENDVWDEMPEGMVAGWRGPAAAMDEETLYAVDESKGVLREYDPGSDRWREVLAEERLRGAEHMAAGRGRVCVVCGGGGIVVVDVVASPPRLWVVDIPAGFQAVAVHILPRMSRPELQEPAVRFKSNFC